METLHLIAQATSNESGESLYGKHGDQRGFELNSRQWYSYPWDCVYRANTGGDRERIASFMEKAVVNGFIGYDTNKNKRDTLYDALLANGYKVDEINTNCATDCSALGFCAVYLVTGVPFPTQQYYIDNPDDTEQSIAKCPRVRHYEYYMESVCPDLFTKLEGASYTDSPDNLVRGDILVAWGNHIGIWI